MKMIRIFAAVLLTVLGANAAWAQLPPPPPHPPLPKVKIHLKAPPRPPARRTPPKHKKLHIKLPHIKLPPHPPAPPRPF